MRHGHAHDQEPGGSDENRALTPEGHVLVERQAQFLAACSWPISRVLSSPLRRAVETASILAGGIGVERDTDGLLAPGASIKDVMELAQRAEADAWLLLVGHQPDLSRIASQLHGASLDFSQGTIALFEVGRKSHTGRLVAYMDAALQSCVVERLSA